MLPFAKWHDNLKGIKIHKSSPKISHLLFVDDCFLFSQASIPNAHSIHNTLTMFSGVSGQLINYNKSDLIFNKGTLTQFNWDISLILRIIIAQALRKYLGLPVTFGRGKFDLFCFIS